jgi:hypothetical protein
VRGQSDRGADEVHAHYDDTLSLVGTSVWMKNGYTMPYYQFAGGHVEFHRVG